MSNKQPPPLSVTPPLQANHIQLTIEKITLTLDLFLNKMPNEKIKQSELRLNECISALKGCPYSTDQEIPSSLISTLYEVQTTATTMQQYIKQYSKLNIATRQINGGKIRAKL